MSDVETIEQRGRRIAELERDLAAQADYAVKLREALDAISRICPCSPMSDCHGPDAVKVAYQALSLTPTEAMRQAVTAKEKAWEDGMDMALKNATVFLKARSNCEDVICNPHISGWTELVQSRESILAELRKKEGL